MNPRPLTAGKRLLTLAVLLLLALSQSSCGYNTMVDLEEQVSSRWAQVENQYQRRADLVPNLVNTVRGAADFEQETLTDVIEARSRATSIQVNPDDLDPEQLQRFQQAQEQLSGALSRLLVSVERYPELRANQNFLNAMGYSAEEVVGQHHRMFVSPEHAASAEYAQLWADLRQGLELTAEWGRLAKGGREVWIQATYLPILDARGRPQRVVKIATDITARKRESLDNAGQITALRASHAVIEFEMDGTIRWANDNFLAATGYDLDEIVGQHHRMFVGAEHAQSADYAQLWADLNAGRFRTAEWRRFAKGGREIWIQASYIPIADGQGRPVKRGSR